MKDKSILELSRPSSAQISSKPEMTNNKCKLITFETLNIKLFLSLIMLDFCSTNKVLKVTNPFKLRIESDSMMAKLIEQQIEARNYLAAKFMKCFVIILKLFRIALYPFMLYEIVIYIIQSYYHYKRDHFLSTWKPQLAKERTNASCRYTDQLQRSLFVKPKDIDSFNEVLRLSSMMSKNQDFTYITIGISIITPLLHVAISLCFLYYGLFAVKFSRMKLDILDFIFHPNSVRARIKQETELILENISISINNQLLDNCNLVGDRLQLRGLAKPLLSVDPVDKASIVIRHNLLLNYNLRLIDRIKRSKKLICKNLSDRWRRIILFIYGHGLWVCSLVGSILGVGFSVIFMYIEIVLRMEQRLEEFKCSIVTSKNKINNQSNQFNAASSESFKLRMELPVLDSEQEIVRYLDCLEEMIRDNAASCANFYQLFHIESSYYFTPEMIFNLFACTILSIMAACLVCNYGGFHVCCHLDKIFWIKQINEDIKICKQSLEKYGNGVFEEETLESCDQSDNLNELILSCYLNMELFRQNQAKFTKASKFLLMQEGIFCASSMTLTYLLGLSIFSNHYVVVLCLVTCTVVVLNIYMIIAATVTNEIDKMRRNILNMLAAGNSTTGPKGSFVLNLFQRQLLDPMDTKDLLAPKFLGILSYTKIMKINGYLMALWLIVLKSNSKNK